MMMSHDDSEPTTLEKVLAFSGLGIIALAILSFFATLIAGLIDLEQSLLTEVFWPFVTWMGLIGVPIGFLLIMALLIITRRRRKRESLHEKKR